MSTKTYNAEVLNKAMQTLVISERSYWPQFITATEHDPEQIVAHLIHCDLPPECHDVLPFPAPQLQQDDVEGVEAQVICTIAELPMFVSFPLVTPILCCMLTGIPSRRRLMKIEERRDAIALLFDRLYEKSGLSELEFLRSEVGKRLVFEMQERSMERDTELVRLGNKKSAPWPLFTSTFSVCGYYQMVINVLLSMASLTVKDHRDYVNKCYSTLRDSIDTLLYSHFDEHSELSKHLRPQLQDYERDVLVYNKGELPKDFPAILRAYTENVLCYMEQCIMAMIDIPLQLREQLVLTVQKQHDDEDDRRFLTEAIIGAQEALMNVRMQVHSPMWTLNSSLLARSATVLNTYKSPTHLVWMFNQLVRRAQTPAGRRRTRNYVRQVQMNEAQLEQLTIQFF